MSDASVRNDVDYISSRLQELLKLIESCSDDLARQGGKLFGYPPEPDSSNKGDRVSPEHLPVITLLDYLDSAVINLRNQVNRF